MSTSHPVATYWPPFVTDPGPKGYRLGTHRLLEPEATLARLHPLLPAMGITRVANVTGLDTIGIPVVVAIRPNARGLAVSQGKGLDLAAAKVSAVMESIEAHHAEHILAPLILASDEELRRTYRVVDVAQLPRVSDRAFHPRLEMLWIEGFDLLQAEPIWLPHELVHANFTLPFPTGSGCFPMTTNGLASGNHPLEAISHAICEAVERDATAIWLGSPEELVRQTRVDLTSIDDPLCREALARFDQAGVAVAVWEITSNIGIPAFFCGITDRAGDPFRRLHSAGGAGCHPARGIALLRALTEAAQSRLTIISGSRDDVFREDYDEVRNQRTLEQTRLVVAEEQETPRSFRDAPDWDGETFAADVAWELDRLRERGFERVIAVDLTKPEFRLPVVRVVIPGLEGPTQLSTYLPGARALARRRGAA
jgi:YcaO-like protein with predicted kinase domain